MRGIECLAVGAACGALFACSSSSPGTDKSGAHGIAGVQLMTRLSGLWSGPATQTPLGDLTLMNMDMRAATPDVLFGRQDIDASDSLRFDFSVESFNGASTLVFHNGGYFEGLLRDTLMNLISADDGAGTYHFCAESGGCGYVDAVFQFGGATQVTLNVHVNGKQHVIWTANQVETRTLPSPFPASTSPQGTPFPTLPQLTVNVSWATPLAQATGIWVVLSTTMCSDTGGGCSASRILTASAPAGATQATLVFQELLPGSYYATALVDNADDFTTTLSPQPGDSVSLPNQSITVPTSGQVTQNMSIVYTIP